MTAGIVVVACCGLLCGPYVFMPALDRAHGMVARWLTVFGRVPFFYYVIHIPLIHVLALIVSVVRTGGIDPWLFADHPMGTPPAPEGYVWSLALLYAVWAAAIVLLYFACRWFGGVKSRRTDWWIRYI